jgi:diamine N-acetyltransferase
VKPNFIIRPAKPGEETLILTLLHELAVYEKITHRFHVTEAIIRQDYFGPAPALHCDLAFEDDRPAGIATWFRTYASFSARRGIYLEDLYVRPEFRGRGYGKCLLATLAKNVKTGGGSHVDWAVLDWNKPSIDFYDGLGAKAADGWITYRLSGEALENLADT